MQYLSRAYGQTSGVLSQQAIEAGRTWWWNITLRGNLHTTKASYGMFDSVRDRMGKLRQETQEDRERKAFEAQMKYLSDDKRLIDGNVYLETIDDLKAASGLSGFREHLPWVSNNPSLAEFKREQSILQSLTEHDRRHPGRVTIAVKKRIARDVETDVTQVETLLDRVCLMRDVQKWILRLKMDNRVVPTTSEQLQQMIGAPGSGFKRTRYFKRRMFPNPGVKPKRGSRQW